MNLILFLIGSVLPSLVFPANEFAPGESVSENIELKANLPVRYLLYEVNPGEGFNLRRDVYMRIANMVRLLNTDSAQQWVLVLPPWGRLFHWQSEIHQYKLPWSKFFDLESLRRHVPVMELADWMQGNPPQIDEIYYLQNYKEGWVDGKWTERCDIRPCIENHGYYQNDGTSSGYHGWFWGYKEITAKTVKCVSVQMEYSSFKNFIAQNTTGRSIMVHRGEQLIHGQYSEWSAEWWQVRRSMRFSQKLITFADAFRKTYLDSDDLNDKTVMEPDWTKQQKSLGSAVGGPYVSVHLRRKDFLQASKDVPSLKYAAEQISEILEKNNLTKLYVATDAPKNEYEELKTHLPKYEVYRFVPTPEELSDLADGGVAIIDQWLCVHARYFIGTGTSTFSHRIHEERSLLGFSPDSTFNRLCGDKEKKSECKINQPGRWFPKY